MDGPSKTCPYCAEVIRAEAIKCRFCGSRVERGAFARSWYRRREGKLVAGVCAGLAAEWGLSVTLIRIAFVVTTFLGFWAVPLYLALWLIMPMKKDARPAGAFEARRTPVSGPYPPDRETERDEAGFR